MSAQKSILMVAFHFPPLAGSSGVQRTLRFVQHLPALGWRPLVLSARVQAYERTSPDLDDEVPSGTVVRRAFALDAARQLSFGGRYFAVMARPDRWVSWRFHAVRQGLALVREHRPAAIWSTYPIATAHLIGAELQRRTGLPWIADFRDPMAQDGYPADPRTHQQYVDIEREALERAAFTTFTTPGAAAEYQRRYPRAATRVRLLENGYDEESFVAVNGTAAAGPLRPGACTLLHSGIVYPSERDPTQLMAAVRLLHDARRITPATLRLRFRAAVAEDLVHDLAARFGVADYVEILPPLPYKEALAEMLRADGLLVLQASNCNTQVPAKLYEYLRAGRPVIALTDPTGDTAHVLRSAGIDAIAKLDDATDIADLLQPVVTGTGRGPSTLATPAAVRAASRHRRTQELAHILDEAASGHRP